MAPGCYKPGLWPWLGTSKASYASPGPARATQRSAHLLAQASLVRSGGGGTFRTPLRQRSHRRSAERPYAPSRRGYRLDIEDRSGEIHVLLTETVEVELSGHSKATEPICGRQRPKIAPRRLGLLHSGPAAFRVKRRCTLCRDYDRSICTSAAFSRRCCCFSLSPECGRRCILSRDFYSAYPLSIPRTH